MNDGSVSKRRILACIDRSEAGEDVVRQAGRLARDLGGVWVAAHVANPAGERVGRDVQERLLRNFRLAQELGGETLTLNGEDVAAELLRYAKTEGVTHIVVGAPSGPWLFEVFRSSPVRRLLRCADGILVEICPRRSHSVGKALRDAVNAAPWANPGAYVAAASFVALATLIALPIQRETHLPNISLIYVLAVIAASIRYGGIVAAFTAVTSSLAYNFFMTQPYYSFTIYDPVNVWAVFFFLLVGVSVSAVAAHTRAQTMLARKQAREALELRLLTQALVDLRDKNEVVRVAAEVTSRILSARAVVMFAKGGVLEMAAEAPGSEILGGDDLAAARWVFEHGREAGRGSETIDRARWLFTPVRGDHGVVAVLGVRPFDEASALDPERRRLLDLIANQIGLGFDRADFARDAEDARVDRERERVKTRLALSALKVGSGSPANVQWLENESDSAIQIHKGAVDVVDLIDAAIDRVRENLGSHFVSRDVRTDLPIIEADRALTEDALAGILEAVAQQAPDKGSVLVRARREEDGVMIEIASEQGASASSQQALALHIAREFLETEGATLTVEAGRATLLFPTCRARVRSVTTAHVY